MSICWRCEVDDPNLSYDPRFKRGHWCDVCKAEVDLEEALKERDESN
jgi:hypothetical protein